MEIFWANRILMALYFSGIKFESFWLRFKQSISTVFVRQSFSLESRWICPNLFQWYSWYFAWWTSSSMQVEFEIKWESNNGQSTNKSYCKDNWQNCLCNAERMQTNYSFKLAVFQNKISFNSLTLKFVRKVTSLKSKRFSCCYRKHSCWL